MSPVWGSGAWSSGRGAPPTREGRSSSTKGRKAIEAALPVHVGNVRRHFLDLVTDAELRTLSTVAGRVLGKLAENEVGEGDGADRP
jgi:hypothetical protein